MKTKTKAKPPVKSIDGNEPHESWGGWEKFLATCEVRGEHAGVVFYGKSNCNYIVFPCGTLVENFGFNGVALMRRIQEQGPEVVLSKFRAVKRKIDRIMQAFRDHDYATLEELCAEPL